MLDEATMILTSARRTFGAGYEIHPSASGRPIVSSTLAADGAAVKAAALGAQIGCPIRPAVGAQPFAPRIRRLRRTAPLRHRLRRYREPSATRPRPSSSRTIR